MVDYTPAELCMRRLIMIQNSLRDLNYIGFKKPLAPSLAAKYGIPELVLFIDSYNGLLGELTARQKGPVLILAELAADVIHHKDALKKARNNWIAHLQDRDRFNEDASEFAKRIGLPNNPYAYHEMFICVILFVDILQRCLPEIAGPAVAKFNRTPDASMPLLAVDPELPARNASAKLERVRKKLAATRPDLSWSALVGETGPGLEKLGGDHPGAHLVPGPYRQEGGAGVQ